MSFSYNAWGNSWSPKTGVDPTGQIPSSIIPILTLIKNQLVTVLGDPFLTNPNLILIVMREDADVAHFQADQQILLRPGKFIALEPIIRGAGRTDARVRRLLEVFLRVRRLADTGDADQTWAMDNALGLAYFDLEESILNALEQFSAYDSNGNALLGEPMRIWQGAEGLRPAGKGGGWGFGRLTFEIVYELPLNTLLTPNWP